MEKKTQAEKEIDLLKTVFKDNEPLLKLVRSLFFGFDLSDAEKNMIKTSFANPELREAFRKKTYPLIDKDVPIGHEADFWGGMENQIFGRDQHAIRQAVESKQRVLDMFIKAFNSLENPFGDRVDFGYSTESLMMDPLQIKLLARNLYFKTITTALMMIKTICDQEEETPAQKTKRLAKDSMK